MRICIVTHRLTCGDGQGRVNYEIAQEVLRRGYQLIILSSHIEPALQALPQVQWVPCKVNQLPTQFLRNLVFARQSAQWLRQHRDQYDLVLSNGAITAAPSDINIAHFVHSTWLSSPYHTIRYRRNLYGLYQWLYTALNARWEKQAFHQTKAVVAVSDQVLGELKRIGIPSQKIRVILNGVDPNEFHPAEASRIALKLPENIPLGLFVGDIRTPRKNLDSVLHALVQVPNLHLAVVGDPAASPFPSLATTLGVNSRVHFLGYRRDIPKLMQAVDFFVFPSRYETFGLVILEAMASGLPVITTTTTGAATLVDPAAGFVLDHPDDTAALCAALQRLTSDRALRNEMGVNARCVALGYTWLTMAQQYVDLAESLLSKSALEAYQPMLP